ncbi:hypothetical protein ACOSQ3_004246 [Xanthoceras sorbifolium]
MSHAFHIHRDPYFNSITIFCVYEDYSIVWPLCNTHPGRLSPTKIYFIERKIPPTRKHLQISISFSKFFNQFHVCFHHLGEEPSLPSAGSAKSLQLANICKFPSPFLSSSINSMYAFITLEKNHLHLLLVPRNPSNSQTFANLHLLF